MRIRASKAPALSSIPNPNPAPSMPPPLNSPPCNDSSRRCEGLDLLVLAVIEVFGDRALEVEHIGRNEAEEEDAQGERIEMIEEEPDGGVDAGPKRKTARRQLAMPSRFQDSVMQPWKRRTRRRLGGAK